MKKVILIILVALSFYSFSQGKIVSTLKATSDVVFEKTPEDLIVDSVVTIYNDTLKAAGTVRLQNATGDLGNNITGMTAIYIDSAIINKGASFINVTTVNAATYDLLPTDYILDVTYTATAAVTSLTLPTAQVVNGRIIVIKDAGLLAGTNNITIDTEGGALIDGSATAVLSTNKISINIYSDGINWFIY